ncbi:hypothetical protein [Xanthomonas phage BUDD]|nr:hypothetical protein [Xanthomonas phage BUDD]
MTARYSRHAKPLYRINQYGELYKASEEFKTTIGRAGVWNRPACFRWWAEGCREINTWVFDSQGQHRLIVGYDPETDLLYLGRTFTEEKHLPCRFKNRDI